MAFLLSELSIIDQKPKTWIWTGACYFPWSLSISFLHTTSWGRWWGSEVFGSNLLHSINKISSHFGRWGLKQRYFLFLNVYSFLLYIPHCLWPNLVAFYANNARVESLFQQKIREFFRRNYETSLSLMANLQRKSISLGVGSRLVAHFRSCLLFHANAQTTNRTDCRSSTFRERQIQKSHNFTSDLLYAFVERKSMRLPLHLQIPSDWTCFVTLNVQ